MSCRLRRITVLCDRALDNAFRINIINGGRKRTLIFEKIMVEIRHGAVRRKIR